MPRPSVASSIPLFFLLLASACSHEAPPPAVSTVTTTSVSPASPGTVKSSIYLSDDLRRACGITAIASKSEAPKFAFDQSAITQDDRDVLAQVAQCLTTGPMKGKTAKLVGRADPRGDLFSPGSGCRWPSIA